MELLRISEANEIIGYNSSREYGKIAGGGDTGAGIGAAANGATAVEHGLDPGPHLTVVTLDAVEITVANTTGISFGGVKIYDFPVGRIAVLASALANLTIGLSNAGNATPIDGDDEGDVAMGTTVAGDGSLTAADVNLAPSTALDLDTSGLDIALLPAATPAILDGTSTAVDAYINMIVDDDDVGDAASDVLELSGTWYCSWVNLGAV